jgi:putative membrane protein
MLISAAAIFAVAYVSEGALLAPMEFWPTAVIAAVVLALVNATVKPVVHVLALPVTILTLGLFSLVINAAMIYLVAAVVPGFETVGFLQTLAAAVVLSIVNAVASKMLERD